MAYILALDQGTTSSRALIFNETLAVVASAQRSFAQFFPQPGFVEQDANEIWASQLAVAREALASASLKASDIAAIGIANQRETTVIWERKTGRPICPAIVWQDRRTADICERLKKQGLEPLFRQKTGLLLDPYFSGTKIRWILDSIPGAKAAALRGDLAFGTIDCWLAWNLTGGKQHITDVSNASRTLLFNLQTLEWDKELAELLGIPLSLLPEVRQSSEIYGSTAPGLFASQIPIGGIAGDQQAALFGQECFEAGLGKATYGTGCFILMNTGSYPIVSKNQLLTSIAWKVKGKVNYVLEGSVFIAGAAIQWLRDELKIIEKSSDIDRLAESVPDTGGVYFVPAFTGLGAPHWDPYARGAIFGLTRGTSRAHIARAVLEGIAFSAADVMDAMTSDAGKSLSELHVDGGVASSDLTMQMQADLIQTDVLRPKNREITALGAAMLAGLSAGIWQEPKELATAVQYDRKFNPRKTKEEMQHLRRGWQKAVERSKKWAEE